MKAKEYLLEIGFDDSHMPELFNDDDKSYYTIIELMEGYAKNIIETNFCDGSPTDFHKLTDEQLKYMHDNINNLVDWVNS